MATTFYLLSAAPVTDVTLSSHSGSYTWTGIHKRLSLTRGGSATTETDNTIAGIGAGSEIAGWNGTALDDGLLFISEPLSAVTINGTATANLRASELNAMANYGVGVRIFAINASGQVQDSGGDGNYSGSHVTELGTSETARNFNPTLGGVLSLSNQWRLIVIAQWYAIGGTSASGYTASGFYNGPTSAASGDSFMTFAETITEYVAAAANPPYTNPMPQLLAQ